MYRHNLHGSQAVGTATRNSEENGGRGRYIEGGFEDRCMMCGLEVFAGFLKADQ